MSRATRLGLALVGAGTVLGLAADALLRETPLGLNAFLWIAAFAAVAAGLVHSQRRALSGGRAWLVLPFVGFGALLLWRDSHWLAALNVFGVVVALSLAVVPIGGFRLRVSGVTEYVVAGLSAFGAAVGGAALTLFDEIGWRELRRGPGSERLAQVGLGLAIAVPLLLLFGGLFVAADAVFADLVRDVAPADVGTPLVHLLVVAAWAWLAIGLLRRLLLPEEEPAPFEEPRPRTVGLGPVELGIALALLDLLFLAFVLVQLRYLFGGSELVRSETGLTYAEYARQGFFELVAAAALVLPLLLIADWALRRNHPRREWVFRVLAALLVVLVFVVMASAFERMRLYQRAYGLTELRVYATGFMLWLAAILVWACATVLRGRRELFAFGALVAGFAAIFTMNALNPDALIARTNVDRSRSGAEIDFRYLGGLSDDAVPALLEALPELEPGIRGNLAENLLARRSDDDWRTWNWSRSRADLLLDEKRLALVAMR
jgi:Domain of unknown function (DUF4173)